MVNREGAEVVVAGHICLDIIPKFHKANHEVTLDPGKLISVGESILSTGGVVPNTGLTLGRLGLPTVLMGKIGGDLFGKATQNLLGQQPHSFIKQAMIVSPVESSSYSIVINPPSEDRVFLHHSGANDTFSSDDVDESVFDGAKLFHFGYPPLMKNMYLHDGREMVKLLKRVAGLGLITSLDMAKPDPDSPAGQVDWRAFLNNVLPHVDLFFPSYEEILFMLERHQFEEMYQKSVQTGQQMKIDEGLLKQMAAELIEMGPTVVAIKLGSEGLYLRTTHNEACLKRLNLILSSQVSALWKGRELYSTCFEADVVGTTGAGDCTVAGFLFGLLQGWGPEQVLTSAVAVGACSVEAADATSGIPSWKTIEARLSSGWKRHPVSFNSVHWTESESGVWKGLSDGLN
ncbi:carbohydrate kinase family protein [Alicyclobacillus dauci]|uniref:Carbohydrate kinase family protein n=1 Tax=Alicyclobacillus dauci TaxID=1475485 RepID=A0ABY6Z6R6_9BACL|nr:carbohydrate kinase family protein [Alicyclobacillus dauci]WAH37971.1 carbohydrate kinase family protein [Alicyclobacillus dauci]